MIRRQFIKLAALTGATGLASIGAVETSAAQRAIHAAGTKTVTWHVQGFTCLTCAVGLEVMLRQQKGVISAEASYPNASVTIQFHPNEVSEAKLRSFISEIGFTADEQKG
jgi:copper chaperone CopZ